jgi:hypothetical protein
MTASMALHLMRIQHLADYGSSSTRTTSRLWALDKDWLDQLKVMPKRGASESEILLMLHECADVSLDEYASPMKQVGLRIPSN